MKPSSLQIEALKVMLTRFCPPSTVSTQHSHSITFHVENVLHSPGFVSSLHRLLSLSNFAVRLSLCLCLFSVCALSCTLLSFVMELLKNSVAMQEQILACKGFLVIGYTLEKVRRTLMGSAGEEIHKRVVFPYQTLRS